MRRVSLAAEADAAAAREKAAQAQTEINASRIAPPPPSGQQDTGHRTAVRMQLLEQLNGPLATRDTPRGLVAVIPASGFTGALLRQSSSEQVGRIAVILASHPGLRVEVEGHTDSADSAALSTQRAEAVREILVGRGIPPNIISARGLGDSRPLASNSTPAGREENQRVEVVISSDAISSTPSGIEPTLSS